MSEYYAVHRDNDTLQHYGIKGMRWGVRKAIESGNQRKLEKQYHKAQKKLYKLNAKADADFQKEIAEKHNKRAKVALGVGAVGLGGLGVIHLANKKATDVLSSSKPRSRKKKIVGEGKDFDVIKETVNENQGFHLPDEWVDADWDGTPATVHHNKPGTVVYPTANGGWTTGKPNYGSAGEFGYSGAYHPGINDYQREWMNNEASKSVPKNNVKTIRDISTAVGVAGLGVAAYQKGRAIAAKHRTTAKGHAKAVAKRDAWRNEMAKVFSGTQYAIRRKHK